jgi:activator of HSP90 ATPase
MTMATTPTTTPATTNPAAAAGTNWKNPSNWHWTGKSCLPWAQEYISARLLPVVVREEGAGVADPYTLTVDKVTVTGDCDLNQRKGKLITIYDLELKVSFTARPSGDDDAAAAGGAGALEGTCEMKDFMHDATVADLDIALTCSKAPYALVQRFKRALPAALFAAVAHFATDLIDAHKQDVYIAPDAMKGHPTLGTYQPKPPVSAAPAPAAPATAAGEAGVKGSLITITQSVEFVASAQDLFACLTEPARLAAWTRGPVVAPTAGPGSPFALFNGNITGTLVESVPGRKLVYTWRKRNWTPGHHSRVVLELAEARDSTTLSLTHTQVPVGEKGDVEANWHQYYWRPIKQTFGYGAQF